MEGIRPIVEDLNGRRKGNISAGAIRRGVGFEALPNFIVVYSLSLMGNRKEPSLVADLETMAEPFHKSN